MKYIFGIILAILQFSAFSQVPDSITLTWCHSEAIKNYPLIKQKELLSGINSQKINMLTSSLWPQVNVNGQLTYQSDVTEIPIKLPQLPIEALDKDQYKLSLDISQNLYDGGITRNQKNLENVNLETEMKNLDAELYKVKERVNQLYFAILLMQENENILTAMLDDLDQRQKKLESGVRNGTVLESQVDVLRAEMLKVRQQLSELNLNRENAYLMLGEFLNTSLDQGRKLSLPAANETGITVSPTRLEPLVMDLQIKKLEVSRNVLSGKYLPRVFAFAQAGYGKPGLNMLNNDFQPFYLVGAKLSWNLWNWGQLKKESSVINYQKEMIEVQKETFNKNLKISLFNQNNEIEKYRLLLGTDQEIIALRTKICRTAASQLENGTLTSSEYISELNQETLAKLNRESHRIQWIKAQVDYLTLAGKY